MQENSIEPTNIRIIEKSTPFNGFFRIDQYCLQHESFKGGWAPQVKREIFERGHAVAVLPYDPDLDQLVLTKQFRIGAFTARESDWFPNNFSPWLVEGVAGIIEGNESPEGVACRESIEETGCQIDKLDFIGHYFVSPGGTSETVFSFIGRVDSLAAGGIHGVTEEGEELKAFVVSSDEAFSWIDTNSVSNGTTMIMLMWLRHNKARLRKSWSRK